MMRLLTLFISALVLLAFISGCGEDAPVPAPKKSPHKKRVESPMPKAIVVSANSATQMSLPPAYAYDPAGRRDPFVALLEVRKPVMESDEPLTELQQVDLGKLRLIGVIIGKGVPMAMVVAPGGKSYFLKNGVKVGRNNGVVIGIDAEGVSVQEKYYDFVGEVRKNIQKIELPKREGAN
jgi:type IV pilus assembly protein PilP